MFHRFFSMELLIGCLKAFPLQIGGGGSDGQEYVRNGAGVVASVHMRTMGEGVKFLPLWCVCAN